MITNASSQVGEKDVTGRESTSMPEPGGSQKQEDMAVDLGSLGKEEVMSQEIGSISVVGIANGLGSIGCCEKYIGTPLINQDIHTPPKWIVNEAN
ncbi:hypothetical protein Q3G72_026722 [Acer saccharum]|nr:hypothetical protein Q3G72_026722 [Acer saccharum]